MSSTRQMGLQQRAGLRCPVKREQSVRERARPIEVSGAGQAAFLRLTRRNGSIAATCNAWMSTDSPES